MGGLRPPFFRLAASATTAFWRHAGCLYCAFALAGNMAPRLAWAACAEVFFQCDLGDREQGGASTPRFFNLSQMRSTHWSDAKIAKKCKVDYSDPAGCNWRGGVASSGGGGTS